MNKLWALLKVTKNDINVFNSPKYNSSIKRNISKPGIILLTIFILLAIIFSIITYVYMLAKPLHEIGLTYIALSIFIILTVAITLIGGVYKSQDTLFTSKDNDMLLSMPINKSTILASRLIRLIFFQYIWTTIIMIPTYGVYIYLENPTFSFYILSLIMLVIIPMIPTVIGAVVGYIVQAISSKFKKKNIIQILFTFIFMILVMLPSMFMQFFIEKIISNSKTINEVLTKIYWPLGVYIDSIEKFNIIKISMLILVNIAILGLFVYVFSIKYFKIISKLSEIHTRSNYKLKSLKTNSALKALFIKEIKRYFSSSIYVMNTMFGPVLMLLASTYLLIQKLMGKTMELGLEQLGMFIPIIGLGIIMFVASTSSTTSSSISLEGKNFWILKSLPVSTKKVFVSKILVNLVVMLPLMYAAMIISAMIFEMNVTSTILLILVSTSSILMISIIGLGINLIFPKLNAPNDTVVVKQSASTILTIFIGFILTAISIFPILRYNILNPNMYICYILIGTITLAWIAWKIIARYGVKRYEEIN